MLWLRLGLWKRLWQILPKTPTLTQNPKLQIRQVKTAGARNVDRKRLRQWGGGLHQACCDPVDASSSSNSVKHSNLSITDRVIFRVVLL